MVARNQVLRLLQHKARVATSPQGNPCSRIDPATRPEDRWVASRVREAPKIAALTAGKRKNASQSGAEQVVQGSLGLCKTPKI